MDMPKTLYVASRAEWRSWLAANHASESEVWLIFYKAHSGQPSLPYEDSVEEALCFGWIDSLIQKIDEDKYARKFTPRKPDSVWSPTNKRRVAKVIREGRMTPAGMSKITYPLDAPIEERPRPSLELPAHIEQVLRSDAQAWGKFRQAPALAQAQLYRLDHLGQKGRDAAPPRARGGRAAAARTQAGHIARRYF